MIWEMGGLEEIILLFKKFIENKVELDFEKGILQAIGYKEFYPFFTWMTNELPHVSY
jgi:tRNA A37 N6-isopentenylltransferase MiaA